MAVMESATSTRLDVRRGEGAVAFKAGGSIFLIAFLAIWLCGWAAGELAATTQLFGSVEPGEGRWFGVIWLLAWTLGGGAVLAFLVWTLFGSERVDASLVSLTHTYRVLGLSRTRVFNAREIRNFAFTEWHWSQRRNTAISFDYGQRTIRIFHGIESAEADATIEVLKSSLGVRRNA
jgi:hypothetical protein